MTVFIKLDLRPFLTDEYYDSILNDPNYFPPMRMEDGSGVVIDTDSKPPTLEDQILMNQSKLRGLQENLKALSAPTRDMAIKRRRQELQNNIDTLTAETKKLIKRYEAQF